MLVEDYPPKLGGGGMFVNSIAKELAATDEQITVVTPSYNGDSEISEPNGNNAIHVIRIGKRRISYFFKGILKLLSEPKFDIYHAHGPLPGLMARIVSAIKDGSTVLHIHGFREENVIGKLKFMGQNFILKLGYDRIISVDSESAKRINEIGVPHDRIETIPCGVDTKLFAPDQGRKNNQIPVLLFVGRLEKVKGLNLLLEAILGLKDNGLNVSAYIIGSGTLEDELMADARKKGLDNIKFINDIVPVMNELKNDYKWWIRLHPCSMQKKDEINKILIDSKLINFDIDNATDFPLYALLRHMDLHITQSSAAVFEAESFGVPSIVTSYDAKSYFSKQILKGTAIYANNAETIKKILTGQLQTKIKKRRKNECQSKVSIRELDKLINEIRKRSLDIKT